MADLVPGIPNALRPLVRRIVAPNGTNTYLLGVDEIAVVDPGSAESAHIDAIVGCGGDCIRWVLSSSAAHGHAAGASEIKARTGATLLGFGAPIEVGGVEPDMRIADGYVLEATEFRLSALHSPGLAPDYVCYLLEDDRIVLVGDLLCGDGAEGASFADLDPHAYRATIERLTRLRPPLRGIGPGHGHFIDDAKAALAHGVRAA